MLSQEMVHAYDTLTVARNLNALLHRRERMIERVALCAAHDWTDGRIPAHPVAIAGASNHRAHPDGVPRAYCRHCGVERVGRADELPSDPRVAPPVLAIDVAIAAARTELTRMTALDAMEVVAWGAASWRGPVSLAVPGMTPWLVTIEPFCAYDHFGVHLGIDGAVHSYALHELEGVARDPYLDDAERTMWALIVRRARVALREAFGARLTARPARARSRNRIG